MDDISAFYTCPCCGYKMFSELPGSYQICDICCWEDDLVQLAGLDYAGGANTPSLLDAQQNFERYGACEERLLSYVRKPMPNDIKDPKWRKIIPERDFPKKPQMETGYALTFVAADPDNLPYYWNLPEPGTSEPA